jgi:hypothetical protein
VRTPKVWKTTANGSQTERSLTMPEKSKDAPKEFVNLHQFPVDIYDESRHPLRVFPWRRRNDGKAVEDCTFLVKGDHYEQFVSNKGPLFAKPEGETVAKQKTPEERKAEAEEAKKKAAETAAAEAAAKKAAADAATRKRIEDEKKAAEAKAAKEAEAAGSVSPTTSAFRDGDSPEGGGDALESGGEAEAGVDDEGARDEAEAESPKSKRASGRSKPKGKVKVGKPKK